MKINNKLKKIGDLVDANSLILDIGCDHALLDIYLVKSRKFKKTIASDVIEGPLEIAKKNIKKEKLEDKIELRLGDGLDTYTPDIDTVIISGMGGRTIIGMFKYKQNLTKNIQTIILSPNNYQQDVRSFFTSIGYKIVDEYLIKDGKITYPIIKLKKGKQRLNKKEKVFGPILLEKKDNIFKEYYQKELESKKVLFDILPKNYRFKKYFLKKEIKLIEKILTK